MTKRNKSFLPASDPRAMAADTSQRVADLHRFGDRVAVYVNPCEATGRNRKRSTQLAYLTATEARAMARALLEIARSIESVKFTESSGTTFTILEEVTKNDH